MGLQGSRVQIPPSRLGGPLNWRPFAHSGPGLLMNLNKVSVLVLLALTSCGGKADRERPPAAGGFSAALGVDTTAMTRTPSGLRYQDVAVGSGTTATAGGNNPGGHYRRVSHTGEVCHKREGEKHPSFFPP